MFEEQRGTERENRVSSGEGESRKSSTGLCRWCQLGLANCFCLLGFQSFIWGQFAVKLIACLPLS